MRRDACGLWPRHRPVRTFKVGVKSLHDRDRIGNQGCNELSSSGERAGARRTASAARQPHEPHRPPRRLRNLRPQRLVQQEPSDVPLSSRLPGEVRLGAGGGPRRLGHARAPGLAAAVRGGGGLAPAGVEIDAARGCRRGLGPELALAARRAGRVKDRKAQARRHLPTHTPRARLATKRSGCSRQALEQGGCVP